MLQHTQATILKIQFFIKKSKDFTKTIYSYINLTEICLKIRFCEFNLVKIRRRMNFLEKKKQRFYWKQIPLYHSFSILIAIVLKLRFCVNLVSIREIINLLERTQATILKIHNSALKHFNEKKSFITHIFMKWRIFLFILWVFVKERSW